MEDLKIEGGCTCGNVRYRLISEPLFVHCCHCHSCQRETGASFALNALIEADRVIIEQGKPVMIKTPSASGKGQKIWRCPECHIALWSNYAGSGDTVHFVRVGTLDNPGLLPPDIHIFTDSKQSWIELPSGIPVMKQYYERDSVWPKASLERRRIHFESSNQKLK